MISIVVSIVGIAVSTIIAVATHIHRQANLRIARQRHVYEWAIEVSRIIPQATEDGPQKSTALQQLSILIDAGRWLFQNSVVNSYGETKHPLRRGYRSKVLHPPVAIHDIGSGNGRYPKETLSRYRDDFFWEVSRHLEPFEANTAPEYYQMKTGETKQSARPNSGVKQ